MKIKKEMENELFNCTTVKNQQNSVRKLLNDIKGVIT